MVFSFHCSSAILTHSSSFFHNSPQLLPLLDVGMCLHIQWTNRSCGRKSHKCEDHQTCGWKWADVSVLHPANPYCNLKASLVGGCRRRKISTRRRRTKRRRRKRRRRRNQKEEKKNTKKKRRDCFSITIDSSIRAGLFFTSFVIWNGYYRWGNHCHLQVRRV